jgi:hypothetical protein
VSDLVEGLVSNLVNLIQRVFINLEPAANSYYSLAAPVVFAGDFEISADFVTTSTSTENIFMGKALFLKFRTNAGVVEALIGNGSAFVVDMTGDTQVYNDGKLHTAKLKKVGNLYTIHVDNVLRQSVTDADAINLTIDNIGEAGGDYFNGIISNVKLTDLATPANSQEYALNQLAGNYELPVNNVLGGDVVVNGDFEDGLTDWEVTTAGQTVEVVAGRLHIVTDGTGAGVQQETLPAGVPVMLEFDYEAVSGSLKVQIGSESFVADTTGHYIFYGVPANNNLFAYRNSGAAEGFFDNISVKQVTNTLTYQNIAETQDVRDTYTLSADGTEWVGALRTIQIAQPPTPLFNSSGIMTCDGTLSCAEIIPCGA